MFALTFVKDLFTTLILTGKAGKTKLPNTVNPRRRQTDFSAAFVYLYLFLWVL